MARDKALILLAWLFLVLGCQASFDGVSREQALGFRDAERRFVKTGDTWKQTKARHVVMQQREYTCGAASLATVLKYYFGEDVAEERILVAALGDLDAEQLLDRHENGLSMEDLRRGASALGYPAAVLEVSYEKLVGLPAPVIVRQVQKKFQHFVVFRGELDGRVFLADPLRGNVRMPRDQFLERWDGKILAVAKRGFRPPERHPLQVDEGGPTVPENLAARRSLFVKVP